jgi:hypothetical protein
MTIKPVTLKQHQRPMSGKTDLSFSIHSKKASMFSKKEMSTKTQRKPLRERTEQYKTMMVSPKLKLDV